MKVDYNFLETKYNEVRQQIIDFIVKEHDLSNDIVVGIVDYENSQIEGEIEQNEVKRYMEQDLIYKRDFNIPLMANMIICNDEGRYQLFSK